MPIDFILRLSKLPYMVTGTAFEQAMADFRAKLVDLVQRRNEVETRISQVSYAMEAMARTCEDPARQAAYIDDVRSLTARLGFQSAIRSALAFSGGMTAGHIRDYIGQPGWMDLSAYSNPLASIYTTLRRMKEGDEIEEFDQRGEKAFRLKKSVKP